MFSNDAFRKRFHLHVTPHGHYILCTIRQAGALLPLDDPVPGGYAASFRAERFSPVAIAESERVKVVLTSFEPGQFIPVHQPRVDVTFLILEGTGTLVAGDRKEAVGPGAMAFIPAGEARGIRAESRLVALHVVTPRPTRQIT